MRDFDPAWASWFAGLTDGEGCFYVGMVSGSQKRDRWACLRTTFQISMREDDAEMILDVHRRLGFGYVSFAKRKPRGEQPTVRFAISALKDCHRLIAVFDAYPLRSKKRFDYAIWRDAVFVRPLERLIDFRGRRVALEQPALDHFLLLKQRMAIARRCRLSANRGAMAAVYPI